ncbi:MAG: hypothetical protein WHS46_02635, partial [Desulfosoma sp.]
MEIKEAIRAALQELIVPELDHIRREQSQMRTHLEAVHKRLDDLNAHLVDQSRRIDGIREELTQRIDRVREELTQSIHGV